MRNLFLSVCLLVSSMSMAQTDLSLKGETSVLKDGEMLYLLAGGNAPADSTVIKNGKFEFSMKGIQPCECCLIRKAESGEPQYILFYLDYCPTYISIEPGTYSCYNTTFMNSTVTGNATDAAVRSVNDMFLRATKPMYGDADFYAKLRTVIARHDMASVYVANKYRQMVCQAVPEIEIKDCISKLTKTVKETKPGKEMLDEYENVFSSGVGAVISDFTLNDVNGQPVSLLKYARGKNLVLIDFWASWCAPCRKEGKNVKSIYNDYHQKGFDVLSVSLDSKSDAWKKAIEEEGYLWTQVSDLKGFESPVCKLFNISAIPQLILIDGDGMIVAKDLRGEILRGKVAEYCQ